MEDSKTPILAQDESLANKRKFPLSTKEPELSHQLDPDQPIPTMHGVIKAVPISYLLADGESGINLRPPKEKKIGSPSGAQKKSTPRSMKRNQPGEEKYNKDVWELILKQRKNGVCDKFYKHKGKQFLCRSLKDIERYETTGKRPSEFRSSSGKAKLKGISSEGAAAAAAKKMGHRKTTGQISLAKKGREEVDQKLRIDAPQNPRQSFDEGPQHQSEDVEVDSEATISG